MNKILGAGLVSLALLNSCASYKKTTDISKIINPTYSEMMLEAGVVTGKVDTKDYTKYDSTSNNYGVFILTEINNKTEYFIQQDRGLHRKVEEDSVVHIIYRLVYEKGKYTGYDINRIVTRGQSKKEELHLIYPMNRNGLNLKRD